MLETHKHAQSCSPELAAVRQLVNGAMQREAGEAPVVPSWETLDLEAVETVIVRHRLTISLADALPELGAPEALYGRIQERAETQRLLAMPMLAAVREVTTALHDAGIRCMAFKGTALAMQTTGDPLARGTGDVDLLIAPDCLSDALVALASVGFHPVSGIGRHLPADLNSWAGRYARWGDYEVAVQRGRLFIDLHWAPTDVRSLLPDFDRLWTARENLVLSGTTIPTFGVEHALIHACCNAAKDQWLSLRTLVDIERLARLREERQSRSASAARPDDDSINQHPAVLFSALITHHCIGGAASGRLAAEVANGADTQTGRIGRQLQRCLATANSAQSIGDKVPDTAAWYLGLWRQNRLVARTVDDRLRSLAVHLLPTSTCFDQDTGASFSIPTALWRRLRRVTTLARGGSGESG